MSFYIVFSYKSNFSTAASIYYEGIYTDLDSAKSRQLSICGENATYNSMNKSFTGNGKISFIDTIPQGDCHVQIHTT